MAKLIQGVNDLETWCKENDRLDLLDEWDYEKNVDLTPQMVSKGMAKKVWWLCEKGHTYQARIADRTDKRCCPVCSGKKVLVGFNDLETTNSKIANGIMRKIIH